MNNYYNQPPPGSQYPYTPPPSFYSAPYRREVRRWGNVIGGALLMVQVLMILVYYLLSYLLYSFDFTRMDTATIDLIDQSAQLVAYVLAFWLPTIFIVLVIKIPSQVAFPMKGPKASIALPAVFVALAVSVVGSVASGYLSIFIETLFDVTPIMPDMPIPEGLPASIVYVISMTLAPAIFEEVLFRGAIMQSLRKFGDWFALLVSSILFAMTHGNLVQGPNAFLMGLVIGYFVLRTGSLLTGMIIHLVNNGFAVALTFVMETMTDQQVELLSSVTFAGYLLIGALALVYLVFRHGGMFQLARTDYPLSGGRKGAVFFLSFCMIVFSLVTILLTALNFE